MKKIKEITQVAVVGAGAMGSGIAQVCIQSGYSVVLYDVNESQLKLAASNVLNRIKKWAEKRNRQEELQLLEGRLIIGGRLEDIESAEIVIEAIAEQLDVKQSLFNRLEDIVSSDTILASNTSGISITDIALGCKNKERVVGTHFFNPAPIMPVVELIQGKHSSEETIKTATSFIESLEKNVVLAKDVPGFIVNRIITPMLNEAMLSYEQGISTKEDIDTALKKAMGHPMGPLELSDYIGLDTLLYFMEHVYAETGNEAYRPGEFLKELVRKGHLGLKTGKGFYEYEEASAKITG
ncbi:3-hydroxyacyl-CoA dehydrogenase [Bacillus sp. OxB-1]|uniref:3-hydroxyacyl-CoA dehydrogenase family protein n=1 Tax=Bacillus sp. (strain OxB-1) TaxID=98228 RepID=UPI000581BF9D|nr:3-hydroxyacyl-CoA dehydrogenase family protein [Bacillus sp. OxB-1]BAQ09072.1 3-hydroxyacyl-CoA dehydrogenase [Bacillus sp. OxB-1]